MATETIAMVKTSYPVGVLCKSELKIGFTNIYIEDQHHSVRPLT